MAFAFRRASLAAASLAVLGLGITAIVVGGSTPSEAADESRRDTYVVEITDDDYNPNHCVLRRGTDKFVQWINLTDETRMIVVVGTAGRSEWDLWQDGNRGNKPIFISDEIAPGELSGLSGPWEIDSGQIAYFDPLHPELPDGFIQSVNNGASSCEPQTPTPTPTQTPTPTPTPDYRNAIAPGVAHD